jgi:hypothetical protein
MLMRKLGTAAFIIFGFCGCASLSIQNGKYVGVTYKQAIEKFGKPNTEQSIIYKESETLHEYQSNLYQALRSEDNVKLIEVWWTENDETIIIWFREKENGLTAIDSLRYGKYVTF